MSESSRPTIEEITLVLAHLADRVAGDPGPNLDPVVLASLRRAVVELERFIPGLDPAPDADAARCMASSAVASVAHARFREALARALRGLSFAPHDPTLHYVAASACLELGAVAEAIRLLTHTLWINPGHQEARRDLESLAAFDPELVAGTGAGDGDAAGQSPDNPVNSGRPYPPRFELLEDDWEECEEDPGAENEVPWTDEGDWREDRDERDDRLRFGDEPDWGDRAA